MIKLRNLDIKMKMILGIGTSILIAMLLLIGVIVYQFKDLLITQKNLLEKELLQREKEKIKRLVQIRAKTLASVYQNNKNKLSQQRLESLIAQFNQQTNLDNNYFFIYSLTGETISTPNLENITNSKTKIQNNQLIKKLAQLAQDGGGAIKYTYANPENQKLETKYSYVEPIKETNYFVGAGIYSSDFQNILYQIKKVITNEINETIYLFITLLLITTICIIFIIIRISDYFEKNVNYLLTGFNKVSNGNLEVKLKKNSNDEFGKLFSGFNYMTNKISDLTYSDPLTNLPNINFLQTKLNSDLNNQDYQHQDIYLFVLGIKNLDSITSNYGYQVETKLFKKMFNRLENGLNKDTIIVRKSNKFIFYFKSKLTRPKLMNLGKRIIEIIKEPYNINNELIYPKPKLGISLTKGRDITSELFIQEAKLAFYFINKYQKDILIYNSKMHGQLKEKINLEAKLKNAIEEDQFFIHYQPIINGRKKEVIGLEALIRWQHPTQGMISPGKFIPLAEDTGMIITIGNWILATACQQVKEWHNQGYKKVYISINIAPQQFQQDNFVQQIKIILKRTNLAPQYLQLEITERTVVENIENTITILKELKELGVKIAIDDFGTGYSSLEYLNRFSIDTLKIDQSFIQNQDNSAIVKTIITIGNNLNLSVIAEGVETREELNFLLKNNCPTYQGYFFSKPLAKEIITELL